MTTPHLEKPTQISSLNISEELTLLMRGFFAMPVISALSRLTVFEVMLSKSTFTSDDFPTIANKKLLEDSFRYLSRISLLSCQAEEDVWALTELGKQVFQRASSFYVPHSYHEYMEGFYEQLTANGTRKPSADRVENVIGSGRTHLRYFPFATTFLKRRVQFDVIADIGCGDGKFLSATLKAIPGKTVVGIDSASVSVQMTQENLRKEHPKSDIHILCADASDVTAWGQKLRQVALNKVAVLSMWFLIHEISEKKPDRIAVFLNRIHDLFPNACLIIGEIVRQESEILARHCKESMMPEYLFFHDMSGQGVLSWEEYHQILQNTPYGIQSERLFDEIRDSTGKLIPSSFVWCLTPKKKS